MSILDFPFLIPLNNAGMLLQRHLIYPGRINGVRTSPCVRIVVISSVKLPAFTGTRSPAHLLPSALLTYPREKL